ncbi:MAG: hypothetical protein JWN27_4552 [Candidatus Eremiobacteraeota bacterium]|nr:hypothetical protein [Candidatus Eremiobacteraeota bacterium]
MLCRLIRVGCLLGAASAWSACGGNAAAPPAPVAAPAGGGPTTPASLTYALSSAGSTQPLPSAGAYGGSVSFPAFDVAPGTTIVATSTAGMPSAVQRAVLRQPASSGSLNVYYAVNFTASRTVTFPGVPGFTVQLPSGAKTGGQQFFYAVSQPSSSPFVAFRTEGPASLSGSTLIFPASTVPLRLDAGVSYTFAFYGTAVTSTPTSLLYATSPDGNYVTAYPATANGDVAPVRVIVGPHTGLNRPAGITHDGAGTIYVANAGSNTITEYPSDADGDVPPLRTIHMPGTLTVLDVAIDAVGAIYAGVSANGPTPVKIVLVYASTASGDATPIRAIDTGAADDVGGIAIDAAGELVVGVNHDIPPPSTRTIDVFAPAANGAALPIRSIAGPNTMLGSLSSVAIGPDGTIYMLDTNGFPMSGVGGFAGNANGNIAPSIVLQGDQTRFRIPVAVAVDADDVLYVANSLSATASEIDVFGPRATGNVAPIRVIAGSHTGLRMGSLMILPRALAYP